MKKPPILIVTICSLLLIVPAAIDVLAFGKTKNNDGYASPWYGTQITLPRTD